MRRIAGAASWCLCRLPAAYLTSEVLHCHDNLRGVDVAWTTAKRSESANYTARLVREKVYL